MRYQQLRIFALIVGVLIHRSAAASFYCDLISGIYSCEILVSDNNDISYDTSKTPPVCTGDGRYCVRGMSTFQDSWDVSITNKGVLCFANCAPILQYCDNSGCKPYCSVDAC